MSMRSRSLASALLAAATLALLSPVQGHAAQPNVLFIIVDDLRPLLGAYGVKQVQTPNIDRLAADGTVFERAYSQWPVCGPSRASFMTGLRPSSSGIYYSGQRLHSKVPDAVTLPQHFRNNGYRTISVGKVYHSRDEDLGAWSEPPWQPPESGSNWQGYVSEETGSLRKRLWQEALAENSEAQLYQFNGRAIESADRPDADYNDGKTAIKAAEVIRQSTDQPFFLAVGFVKPHMPFAAPQKYWDFYDRKSLRPAKIGFKPAGASDIPYVYAELRSYYGIPDDLDMTRAEALELIHGYHAAVSFIDAQVGLLLDALDRAGKRKNTIVVLIGDHGFHLGEQGLWGKHSLYETSLLSPLIVSAPQQETTGVTTRALVEFVDIYPSLVEMAGLPAPTAVDGTSFVPLLANPDMLWKESALSQYQHFMDPHRETMGYSIRVHDYRYTEWRNAGSIVAREFYPLAGMPQEVENVADRSAYESAVDALSQQIDQIVADPNKKAP